MIVDVEVHLLHFEVADHVGFVLDAFLHSLVDLLQVLEDLVESWPLQGIELDHVVDEVLPKRMMLLCQFSLL
jgi:hypothetical protein